MNLEDQYKKFLDEIGWDEFNNIEREYFFDDIKRGPNGEGILFQILPSESKHDNIIIKYKYCESQLEIPQKKLLDFRNWVERNFANGEDGSDYYAWKEAMKETYTEIESKVKPLVQAINLPSKEDTKADDSIDIEALSRAVGLWLNYQTTVSSSVNLLHEASFRYPVAEFIERKVHSATILEEDHPIFVNRPTDFQWKMKNKNYFLECKFVKKNYTNKGQEFQRYLDDICRLYYCIKDENTDISYFLVCGHKEDCEKCLLASDTGEKGNINKKRYNYILGFKKDEIKELTLDSTDQVIDAKLSEEENIVKYINKAYDHFRNDYKENLPTEDKEDFLAKGEKMSLLVKCLYTPNLSDDEYVFIWQVQKGHLERINEQPIIAD